VTSNSNGYAWRMPLTVPCTLPQTQLLSPDSCRPIPVSRHLQSQTKTGSQQQADAAIEWNRRASGCGRAAGCRRGRSRFTSGMVSRRGMMMMSKKLRKKVPDLISQITQPALFRTRFGIDVRTVKSFVDNAWYRLGGGAMIAAFSVIGRCAAGNQHGK